MQGRFSSHFTFLIAHASHARTVDFLRFLGRSFSEPSIVGLDLPLADSLELKGVSSSGIDLSFRPSEYTVPGKTELLTISKLLIILIPLTTPDSRI